jgi:hypothetical protein
MTFCVRSSDSNTINQTPQAITGILHPDINRQSEVFNMTVIPPLTYVSQVCIRTRRKLIDNVQY